MNTSDKFCPHCGQSMGSADSQKFREDCELIISYLNARTGKRFKGVESDKRKIRARLKEDFLVHDFLIVIDKKTKDWGQNPEMSQYLRPITLFGNKFEGYLQEARKETQNDTTTTTTTKDYSKGVF